MLVKQEKELQEQAKRDLLTGIREFTAAMDKAGPYFSGGIFGFVDIAFLPWALRLYILKHFRGFELPESDDLKRFQRWFEACKLRKGVQDTMPEDERLLHNYDRYADASTKSKSLTIDSNKENKDN
eukprot:TRINITY_DN16340_c0_g1_i1.p1 TRINITY_DN16340_c0_g1~~TRINITY_DN16340_c0_g1_i1.p1  ORF type:complete len:126 (+),score=32.61 TRINITY_DN16340_c0_g1_i1:355-732(+)